MTSKPKTSGNPRKASLTHEDFVDAAVRLAKHHGLSKLTMRLLAEELNVSPMALYYYIPNKEALFELTVDAIFAQIKIPTRRKNSSWRSQYLALDRASKAVTDQFPDYGAVILDIPVTPNGSRVIHAALEILLDAGFNEEEAMKAYSMIHTYSVGRLLVETNIRTKLTQKKPSSTSRNKADNSDRFRPYLANIKGFQYQSYAINSILDALDQQLQAKKSKKK